MKRYLPSIYQALIALLISVIVGFTTTSQYYMSITLIIFVYIYFVLGYIYRRVNIKNLRKETNNPFGILEIKDKKSFFASSRALFLGSFFTLIIYFILLVLGIGK